jgi:hypothetical protein
MERELCLNQLDCAQAIVDRLSQMQKRISVSGGRPCPGLKRQIGLGRVQTLASRLEGPAMSRRPAGTLSAIENEVIQEIRALRASP